MKTVIVLDAHCTDLLHKQMELIEVHTSGSVSTEVQQLRNLAELLKTELKETQLLRPALHSGSVLEIRIDEQLLK